MPLELAFASLARVFTYERIGTLRSFDLKVPYKN